MTADRPPVSGFPWDPDGVREFPAGAGAGAAAGSRGPRSAAGPGAPPAGRQVALIDLLDRLLTGGAVLTGDVVLSVADIDLVHINLRAVIHALGPDDPGPW